MPPANYSDPRIREALDRAISLGEIGIGVAAYHRGELIVDAIAGLADKEAGRPADPSTLWPVFSVTKGVTALAVHMQADRGYLDLDALIATYWPEFAANGKGGITVEMALSHRAGIPQMLEGVTPELMKDWEWMVGKIAEHKPLWEPGTANAYHILVWGWILGEVVVRTDPKGRAFDVFVQEEICQPLGIKDFFLGVPDSELGRVSKLYGGEEFGLKDEHNVSPRAVYPSGSVHNMRVVQQTVDPGAGAITSAPAAARIFALLAEGGELDGVRLLSKERAAGLTKVRDGAHDPDKLLPIPVWFGRAGCWLGGEPMASDPLVGDHREIIVSPGAGYNLAWADLKDHIAVTIFHNNMDTAAVMEPERPFAPIVRAIREIVAERG